MLKFVAPTCLLILLSTSVVWAGEKSYGLALYGPQDLRYKPGEPYRYANPNAPRGGTVVLGSLGSFTKLNPFSLKGRAAPNLGGFVFETLADGSADDREPFSQYGRIAQYFKLAADRLSLTYYLNPKAHFSDGHALTADDVIFSFEIIRDPEYRPFEKGYYADVIKAEKIDAHTVKFYFKKYNQELPLIMGQLSILPRHIYGAEGKQFGKDFDDIAVGSGPYIVDSFDRSKFIKLKRDPNYWGNDLPVNRGRYNFDEIMTKIYLDSNMMLEATKGGAIDIAQVNRSKDWALEFNGDFFKKKYIIKKLIPHNNVAGMQGFIMNIRRPIFQDFTVRKIIAGALDFPAMNKNLFYGQYTRQVCYFDNNKEMKSRGPATGKVKTILEKLRKKYNDPKTHTVYVRKDAIRRGPYIMGQKPDGTMLPMDDFIKLANKQLDKRGWVFDPKLGARKKGDRVLDFEILIAYPAWQPLINPFCENLKRLGIKARYQYVQPAALSKRANKFDFDMMVMTFGQSLSPGNEQRNYWTSKFADIPGSRNLIGIKNPAIDEVVEKLVEARDRKTLVTYVHVLDRILSSNFYLVPHWYIDKYRAVYWNKYAGPKVFPRMDFISTFLNWWWYVPAKDKALQQARANGVALDN